MIVRVYSSFEQLPAAHQEILTNHAAADFFRSNVWFQNLIDTTLPKRAQVRLYAVQDRDNSALRCLLVTRTPAAKRSSILQGRPYSRRTLGGLTNLKTNLFGPIIPPAIVPGPSVELDGMLGCLARHLRAENPPWDLIDFSNMEGDSQVTDALATALRDVGYVVKPYRGYFNYFQPVNGNFESFVAELPKLSRTRIKRILGKYEKLRQSHRTELKLFEDAAESERAIRDYALVFAASWKRPDVHPEFIPKLITAGLATKSLRLMILYVDDQPAAVELTMISEGRAILYRTAYDPKFATYSPGSIATTKSIEHMINCDQVTEIDFGRDGEKHKRIWARHSRERIGIIAFDVRTMGGVFGLSWHLGEGIWKAVKRKVWKQVPPLL